MRSVHGRAVTAIPVAPHHVILTALAEAVYSHPASIGHYVDLMLGSDGMSVWYCGAAAGDRLFVHVRTRYVGEQD